MKQLAGIVLLILLTTACSFRPDPDDSIPSDNLTAIERQEKLQRIDTWGLKGRISVRTPDDGASASLVWDQQKDRSEVSIFGAFGLGAMRLVQKPDDAVLYRNGEKPVYARTAEELLLWETGLKVPLNSMRLWLRGLPGEVEDVSYDSYGRLRSLFYTDEFDTQWAATFERYRDVDGNQLPVRIRVEGGDYVIKLRTESWDVEASEQVPETERLQIPGISS